MSSNIEIKKKCKWCGQIFIGVLVISGAKSVVIMLIIRESCRFKSFE